MWEEVGTGRREGAGWRRCNRRARGGPDSRLGGDRARAERTSNMACMVVTLDVSKLSGWLNADADCRVDGRAWDARRGVPPGRREGVGWRRRNRHVHGEGPAQGCGGQGTRGAHVEHAAHVRDLGRVEAERLVERRRALPSRKVGMRCGKRYGPGGVRALGTGDASGMHGEGPTQGGRAGAERTWNM